MTRLRTLIVACVAIAAGLAGAAAQNREQIPAERRIYGYDAQLPACDDSGVLGRLQGRFQEREALYWDSTLTITRLDRVKQTHFRPNGMDLIPRRYCTARAEMSDGKHRHVIYSLVEDGGIAGWQGTLHAGALVLGRLTFATSASYAIDWCVQGLDRHNAYSPSCRLAAP
jgi:hypothetical protein